MNFNADAQYALEAMTDEQLEALSVVLNIQAVAIQKAMSKIVMIKRIRLDAKPRSNNGSSSISQVF